MVIAFVLQISSANKSLQATPGNDLGNKLIDELAKGKAMEKILRT